MIPLGSPVPEAGVYDGKGEAPLPVFFAGPTLLIFFHADSVRSKELLQWAATVNRHRSLTVIGVSQETIEDTAGLLQSARVRLPMVIDDRPYPASRAFEFTTVPAAALVENDVVSWVSDGCSTADLATLVEHLRRLTGDAELAVAPVSEAPPDHSRHLGDADR